MVRLFLRNNILSSTNAHLILFFALSISSHTFSKVSPRDDILWAISTRNPTALEQHSLSMTATFSYDFAASDAIAYSPLIPAAAEI